MKEGRTIQELAVEVRRQAELKADYVADTRKMGLSVDDEGYVLTIDGTGPDGGLGGYVPTDLCHQQIAGRLDIPWKFYGRLRGEHRDLLTHNVQTLWRERPEKRMVRTLDGNARAFLSNRYRRLDNLDLIEAVVPVLAEVAGGLNVVSCEVTEKRLYLKALFPRIEAEVGVGDVVQAGILISNSEVGSGALTIAPLLYRLICKNGMVAQDYGTRRNHVGKRIEEDDAMAALYRDETVAADDKAFWMKVEDLVRATATEAVFQEIVRDCKELAALRIEAGPVEAVEKLGNRFDLNETERGGVLSALIEGADLTAWGLLNSLTRYAQDDALDYDRATELEAMGGKVLALPRNDLRQLIAA